MGKKEKSQERWIQHNYLVDEINPRLKNATYIAVLWACFRHGKGFGYFRASTARVARCARTSKRNARRIIDDFQQWGLIELIQEHQGPIPRTYRIRFSYAGDRLKIDHVIPKEVANGRKTTTASV